MYVNVIVIVYKAFPCSIICIQCKVSCAVCHCLRCDARAFTFFIFAALAQLSDSLVQQSAVSLFFVFDRLDGLNCLMWLVVFLFVMFHHSRWAEVLLVSSDSVCGVLDWGNWVFRLVFEGEAIQRISKYKSYKRMCKNLKILCFFFEFPVTQFSGGQHAETGLDYLHQHPGAAVKKAWHRLSAFVKQHEVFGNRVNLLTQLGTFLSPVAPVRCSQCSTMFLLFHSVIMSLCS